MSAHHHTEPKPSPAVLPPPAPIVREVTREREHAGRYMHLVFGAPDAPMRERVFHFTATLVGLGIVIAGNIVLTKFLRGLTGEIPWLPDEWRHGALLFTIFVCMSVFRFVRLRLDADEVRTENLINACQGGFDDICRLEQAKVERKGFIRWVLRKVRRALGPGSIGEVIRSYNVDSPDACRHAVEADRRVRLQRWAVTFALLATMILGVYYVLWKATVYPMNDGTGEQIVMPLWLPERVEQYLANIELAQNVPPLGWAFAENRTYLVEAFRFDYPFHTAWTAIVFGCVYLALCVAATVSFALSFSDLEAVLESFGIGGGVSHSASTSRA